MYADFSKNDVFNQSAKSTFFIIIDIKYLKFRHLITDEHLITDGNMITTLIKLIIFPRTRMSLFHWFNCAT